MSPPMHRNVAALPVNMKALIFFSFLAVFAKFTTALYFHIGETEKKCFIEEIPDETMVVGKSDLV